MSQLVAVRDLEIDSAAPGSVLPMIEFLHYMIHDEKGFSISYTSTLAAGATATLFFRTPSSVKRMHFVGQVGAGGALQSDFRESATVSLSGTVLTVRNRDRNSSEAATMTARHTPTVTTHGVRLDATLMGTTVPGKGAGGSGVQREEWILKANTIYLWRVLSLAAANQLSMNGSWYEI